MATKLPRSRIHLSSWRPQRTGSPRAETVQYSICARCFSQSLRYERMTNLRKGMWQWINGPGAVFQEPQPNRSNYLGAYDAFGNRLSDREGRQNSGQSKGESIQELRPFPLNRDFRSQPVLSVELRDEIYRQIVEQQKTVREVSANLGVDMKRVGAVVRLKTIENDWIRQNKRLAKPYQNAVLGMLPLTPFKPGIPVVPHETINDLPVHAATVGQLFHPVSESRHFTRTDAGKVFDDNLLPAEARIPHPELVEKEKDKLSALTRGAVEERHAQRLRQEVINREEQKRRESEDEAKRTTVVAGRRWDFKFRDINAEDVGKDGRGPAGVGWRYGFPHEDRKRAQVKIPTSVP